MLDETSPVLAAGTLIAGRFTIRRVLGRGGMATVYEAFDARLRQRVAIKVLSSALAGDGAVVERFVREARAVASLRNRHVVRVTDAATLPSGEPYLVMEYLDGRSLGSLLAAKGVLPPPSVVEYVLQALEALAEAHRSGIVHRDLKPENLMLVVGEDGLPLLKIIDFGISKVTGAEFTKRDLTARSSFLGSPVYAAPEQLRDTGLVDARADIWSLGVVMHELLTGKPPFKGTSPVDLIAAICTEEPPKVSALRSDVSEAFADVVLHCLQKDVELRCGSAQQLAVELAPFAPDARSRISVDHVLRVQSSALLCASGDETTTPSLTPSWSAVSVVAPTTLERKPLRLLEKRSVWVGLAAATGVIAALAQRAQPSTPAPAAQAAVTSLPLQRPAAGVAPPETSERTTLPETSVSAWPAHAGAPAAAVVVQQRTSPRGEPWDRAAAERRRLMTAKGEAKPFLSVTTASSAVQSNPVASAQGPTRVRAVRPLDTENPFNR